MGMSFFTLTSKVPEYYLIFLINSEIVARIVFNFLNNTSHFQINDCRILPIPIPTQEELLNIKNVVEHAEYIQKEYFDGIIDKNTRDEKLKFVQEKVDSLANKLYGME